MLQFLKILIRLMCLSFVGFAFYAPECCELQELAIIGWMVAFMLSFIGAIEVSDYRERRRMYLK